MQGFIDGLIGANSNPNYNEGDYIKDGLLHCGKCRFPKQCMVTNPFTGEERKVNCICKCVQDDMERRESEAKAKADRARKERIRSISFNDSDYAGYTFDIDDKEDVSISKQMRNYARHFSTFLGNGQGLLLFGDVGTGKTFYSACIANQLINDGYTVNMTNFPTLIGKIQKSAYGGEDVISSISKCDLLIIDDLGVESSSEFRQENVYAIIDARYRANKPMVISTNLTAQELKQPKDVMSARIYGRILERCLPIKFSGHDRRKRNARYDEIRSILNAD